MSSWQEQYKSKVISADEALAKRLANRRCNIFMGVAAPPDKHGNMSLSLSVTYEKELIRQADLVIPEVKDQFPRTFGDSMISVSDVDFLLCGVQEPGENLEPWTLFSLALYTVNFRGKYCNKAAKLI